MTGAYFICGFIGSGKTTYSKKLSESSQAFRFSIDEWMIPLYGEHMERSVFDARVATLHNLFKDAALQMLNLGVPVIFDFGFWKKTDREHFAQWATENSVEYEFHFLDVSFEECSKRALRRNSELKGTAYEMTPEMLSMFWSWFEPPALEDVKRVSS